MGKKSSERADNRPNKCVGPDGFQPWWIPGIDRQGGFHGSSFSDAVRSRRSGEGKNVPYR